MDDISRELIRKFHINDATVDEIVTIVLRLTRSGNFDEAQVVLSEIITIQPDLYPVVRASAPWFNPATVFGIDIPATEFDFVWDLANVLKVPVTTLLKMGLDLDPFIFIRDGHIQRVTLSNIQIRILPQSIGNLSKLRSLHLSGCALTALPDEIGELISLTAIWCPNNNIKSLPDTIGNLKHVELANFSANVLTMLPDSIVGLVRLSEFHCSNNNIVYVPVTIGRLQNLRVMHLDGNQIEVIPPSLGNLRNLTTLDLRSNKLKDIPLELSSIRPGYIYVTDNPLAHNSERVAFLKSHHVRIVTDH